MSIPFEKWHGLENDYVIVDPKDVGSHPPEMVSKTICSRRTGLGADGMILLSRTGDEHARFIIINADGTRAELCGNGLRCAAAMLASQGGVVSIQSDVGLHSAEVHMACSQQWQVDIDLVPASHQEVSLDSEIQGEAFHHVVVGNPHAVRLVNTPLTSSTLQVAVGDHPESESWNVHVAYWDGHALDMQSMERGVGEVRACATGAAAVAAVARKCGMCDQSAIPVRMPGGILQVTAGTPDVPVRTSGLVTRIASGEWLG